MDVLIPPEATAYKPNAADERFVFNQLIAYIGNKRKLLAPLVEALGRVEGRDGSFVDFFSGSGVVSRLAKLAHYRVVANDWEPYAYALNQAFIATNALPPFAALGGVEHVYRYLNDELPPLDGYIARHYCPRCDERPDPDNERMFYTQENGRRIDAIREQIDRWHADGLIDPVEQGVLLASLIYAASYHSNTSGVFKAFHRGWGGATRTAWYRIRARLALRPPTLYNNQQPNLALCADANALARELTGDVAYLDPPYNQHQYGANYHLLNTVALWDKPPLSPHTRVGGRTVNKSAIRQDWLQTRRSAYCYRTSAVDAFADLLAVLRFRSIIVSYSSDGIVPLDELLRLLHARGAVAYIEQPYKRYRVSSQRYSPRSHTLELTFLVDTSRASTQAALCAMREQLDRALDLLADRLVTPDR
jgi:adenine-specific DNA-methyltransferase